MTIGVRQLLRAEDAGKVKSLNDVLLGIYLRLEATEKAALPGGANALIEEQIEAAAPPGIRGPFFGADNFAQRTYGQWTRNQSATGGSGGAMDVSGALGTPTETGTVTYVNDDTDSLYKNYLVGSVGLPSGVRWPLNNAPAMTFSVLPRMATRFKWPAAVDMSLCRMWIGMAEDPGNLTAADSFAADEYVCLRWTHGTDTNWKFCSSDGTTASEIDTGIAPTAATPHYVVIDCTDSASAKAYLNGVLIGTKTTNLPTGGLIASVRPIVGLTRLTGATASNLRIAYVQWDRQ